MKETEECLISVVVPVFNEGSGIELFNKSITGVLDKNYRDKYEIIYCDDGSIDNTSSVIERLYKNNHRIKLIKFSRNFGKESALTAGIANAIGQAIITIDGDGQHPVNLIPEFVKRWQSGYEVVIGVRENRQGTILKNIGSRLFYRIFNTLNKQELVPGATDYRLIDKSVQTAFLKLDETNRITRGLIDWLGFKRSFVRFKANARKEDKPGYSTTKLLKLASNSVVSFSPVPLYMFGYLGVVITFISLILGLAVIIEQIILGDPLHWKFTGSAMLSILILFLVGIILMSQGILSLYISHIHSLSKKRPLYVIDMKNSIGVKEEKL